EPFPCAVLHHRFGASRPIHPLDPAEIVISGDEWEIIRTCKKENPETWRKAIDCELLGRYAEFTKRESWIRQNEKLPANGTLPNEGDFTKIGDKYRGKIDLLVGGTPCFPSGAMVLTPSGYAPIETIKVGDTIVSANGNQCKVSATGNKSAETGAVKIVGRPAIRCTKDHPFLTCCGKRDNKRTTSTYAQLVAPGEYCYTGIKESVGRYAGRLAAKPIPYTWPVCETAELQDIIELAGWYVGDGYIRRWKGESKKAIVFALVSEHKIKQFTSRFRNCFKFFTGKDGKITLCNTRIADWLSHNFGELSYAKHLPYWLYKSDFADDFMVGYIATDGHRAKRGITVISTTSSSLAYGLADLAGNASVCFHKVNPLKVIDGRQIHQRDYYTVSIYKGVTPKTKMFLGRWASRIMNWSEPKIETVYNIEVEDEHTYVVNGIAVHNCQSFSVAGKRAGLAGVSGLALDFIKLAYESQVKWIVWENVPGCFSTNGGRDFGAFLSGLSGIEIATP
ncbi:MAG: hypothetical protein EOM62_20050, partial [Bacteroidia bacterium]|nr:hypothetical protein [Bacteroidia bacterium]